MTDILIKETREYEKLVPFFMANELEFTEEDAEEVPTDILKCWKAVLPGESGKERLIGGFVLAKRQEEYICDGIAVDSSYRNHDLGKKLLSQGIQEVRARAGSRMYLVARAPEFFRKQGFQTVKREDAPNFFECLTCPQYGKNCTPEVMVLYL